MELDIQYVLIRNLLCIPSPVFQLMGWNDSVLSQHISHSIQKADSRLLPHDARCWREYHILTYEYDLIAQGKE
ncbi:hypothetical protein BpHYR1_025806 [Brachionus plicatilis]|uniref:Uncharacterized protein n=1 Tax=Brachionus plicatilis TaxID=10195 RepID=A0A3M7PPU0_BRAPC|nr:hypothetical protein BpHYR1_025806 [Brachionus plicatilis]